MTHEILGTNLRQKFKIEPSFFGFGIGLGLDVGLDLVTWHMRFGFVNLKVGKILNLRLFYLKVSLNCLDMVQ